MLGNSKFSRHRGVDDVSARTSCSIVYTTPEEIPLTLCGLMWLFSYPIQWLRLFSERWKGWTLVCCCKVVRHILYQCTACQDSKAAICYISSSLCMECASCFIGSFFQMSWLYFPFFGSVPNLWLWQETGMNPNVILKDLTDRSSWRWEVWQKNCKKPVISDLVRL